MKSTKLFVAAAALSGLLLGTAARASALPVSGSKETSIKKSILGVKAVALDDKEKDKHDCKGKNDCKGKGRCGHMPITDGAWDKA